MCLGVGGWAGPGTLGRPEVPGHLSPAPCSPQPISDLSTTDSASKPTAGSPLKRPRQNQAAMPLPETWWKLHSCFPFLSLSCWPRFVTTSFLGSLLHRNSPLWVCFWGVSPKWGHPNLTEIFLCALRNSSSGPTQNLTPWPLS